MRRRYVLLGWLGVGSFAFALACRRGPDADAPDAPASATDADARAPHDAHALARPAGAAARLMDGVVDPWTSARAAAATDDDRAIEDIGPYEPTDPERARRKDLALDRRARSA